MPRTAGREGGEVRVRVAELEGLEELLEEGGLVEVEEAVAQGRVHRADVGRVGPVGVVDGGEGEAAVVHLEGRHEHVRAVEAVAAPHVRELVLPALRARVHANLAHCLPSASCPRLTFFAAMRWLSTATVEETSKFAPASCLLSLDQRAYDLSDFVDCAFAAAQASRQGGSDES